MNINTYNNLNAHKLTKLFADAALNVAININNQVCYYSCKSFSNNFGMVSTDHCAIDIFRADNYNGHKWKKRHKFWIFFLNFISKTAY